MPAAIVAVAGSIVAASVAEAATVALGSAFLGGLVSGVTGMLVIQSISEL